MSAQTGYHLRKTDRLGGRKNVEAVFSRGKSFSVFPLRVLWLPENDKKELQAGFGVGARHFRKATDRNRIKRMMREAYRLQRNRLNEHLVSAGRQLSVFILFSGNEMPGYNLVFEKMNKVIEKLIVSVNEKGH